jgi:hypothetical protein
MQIDLKAAEGEIGVNMIIEVRFQIQLINRNEKISGWSFLILGSSCKSRGTEIYLWTDPACFFCYYYCSTADTTSTATYSGHKLT